MQEIVLTYSTQPLTARKSCSSFNVSFSLPDCFLSCIFINFKGCEHLSNPIVLVFIVFAFRKDFTEFFQHYSKMTCLEFIWSHSILTGLLGLFTCTTRVEISIWQTMSAAIWQNSLFWPLYYFSLWRAVRPMVAYANRKFSLQIWRPGSCSVCLCIRCYCWHVNVLWKLNVLCTGQTKTMSQKTYFFNGNNNVAGGGATDKSREELRWRYIEIITITQRLEAGNGGESVKIKALPGKDCTLPTRAGMFIEFVANPIPNVMADSTPRNLATSFSSSSCLSRLPEMQTDTYYKHVPTATSKIWAYYPHFGKT